MACSQKHEKSMQRHAPLSIFICLYQWYRIHTLNSNKFTVNLHYYSIYNRGFITCCTASSYIEDTHDDGKCELPVDKLDGYHSITNTLTHSVCCLGELEHGD